MARALSEISVRHYGEAPGGHAHDHAQVLWPLAGCLELEVEGRGVALRVGDALLVRPGERHDFESRLGSRCLVLDTDAPDWLERAERPQFARSSSQMAAFVAVALAEGLPLALQSGARLLADSWGPQAAAPAALTMPRRPIDWTRLSQWAAARLHQRLLAAALAAQVHLGESQFRARCLEEQGITPMQWLRRLRLERALQLRANGLPVGQVALAVGYESPSALTAALRRQQSPR